MTHYSPAMQTCYATTTITDPNSTQQQQQQQQQQPPQQTLDNNNNNNINIEEQGGYPRMIDADIEQGGQQNEHQAHEKQQRRASATSSQSSLYGHQRQQGARPQYRTSTGRRSGGATRWRAKEAAYKAQSRRSLSTGRSLNSLTSLAEEEEAAARHLASATKKKKKSSHESTKKKKKKKSSSSKYNMDENDNDEFDENQMSKPRKRKKRKSSDYDENHNDSDQEDNVQYAHGHRQRSHLSSRTGTTATTSSGQVSIGHAKATSALIPTPPSSTTARSTYTTESSNSDNTMLDLQDDVYNMFFLSRTFGQAFFYAVYIYFLKLSLYTVIAIHLYNQEMPDETDLLVQLTQFFLLPVAVAIQEDLISCYFIVANMDYSPDILSRNPGAHRWKFNLANACRGFDGLYSLGINFIVLLQAGDVLSLFLNFAALQFLQTIDNVALHLAADGYLTERLEEVADNVAMTKLPRKQSKFFNTLDSVLFLSTLGGLLAAYFAHTFHQSQKLADTTNMPSDE